MGYRMKGSALGIGVALVVALVGCGKKDEPKPQQAPPAVTPTAAPAPAAAAEPAGPPKDTVSLMVAHEVEDFDKWKQAFDAHSAARQEAGAIWHAVARDVDNPNLVYVHIVGTDLAKAQAFASSDDLAKAMVEAGVKGAPAISFARDVEIDSPRGKVEGETYSLFVTHEVEAFDAWKTLYDADAAVRKEVMGVLGGSVSRAVDDPNLVLFHFTVGDPKRVVEAMASDEMKQKLAEAGVKGAPQVRVAKDVETSTY